MLVRGLELRNRACGYFNRAAPESRGGKRFNASAFSGEAGRVLRVDLYDEIDSFWGIGPEDVAGALQDAGKIDLVDVHMNSIGGNVFDGAAIYNLLKAHSAQVLVTVEGLAASSGSLIAMAGDRIVMGEAAWMVLHRVWGAVGGNAEDMREMADLLDRMTDEFSVVYQRRSGQEAKVVDDWIAAETWFSGKEAVEAGLADESSEESNAPASAMAGLDLSVFGYSRIPDDLRALVRDPVGSEPSEGAEDTDETEGEEDSPDAGGTGRLRSARVRLRQTKLSITI